MRAAHPILAVAILAFAPTALAQTDTQVGPAAEAATEQSADGAAAANVAIPAAPTEDAGAAEEATPAAEPERVCRTIERSESRLQSRRERICRTRAEWDAQQRGGNRSNAQPNNN